MSLHFLLSKPVLLGLGNNYPPVDLPVQKYSLRAVSGYTISLGSGLSPDSTHFWYSSFGCPSLFEPSGTRAQSDLIGYLLVSCQVTGELLLETTENLFLYKVNLRSKAGSSLHPFIKADYFRLLSSAVLQHLFTCLPR